MLRKLSVGGELELGRKFTVNVLLKVVDVFTISGTHQHESYELTNGDFWTQCRW